MRLQRTVQTITLSGFIALLLMAGTQTPDAGSVDFYLRMDPIIGLGTALASWELLPALWPSLAVVLATLAIGRIFCGHVCPMGATLDIFDAVVKREKKNRSKTNASEANQNKRNWKYYFLAIIGVAGLLGVSLVHVGSPLSWATRIWGLLIYPLALIGLDTSILWVGEIFRAMGDSSILYIQPPQRVFSTGLLIFAFFVGSFLLVLVAPRYWCRKICPAGALLALCSKRPLLKRRVSYDCINCGQCVAQCPTSAITEDPSNTLNQECIVCLKCKDICPVSAISFSYGPGQSRISDQDIMPRRRALLYSLATGVVTAGVISNDIHRPKGLPGGTVLRSGSLIRPPGSRQEEDFLKLCVRCGACMKACPTNTLQPIWFKAGLEGMFSPILFPRLGPCAVNCNECGKVCPTGAIRHLPMHEKQNVKMGSAWIIRQNCLVWEQDRKCLVCDEVCPYNALSFQPVKGLKNSAPFVIENRCTGCGWCENKCPVLGDAAIRVNIIGEVRLNEGSYVEKAQQLGLVFKAKDNKHDKLSEETFEGVRPQPVDNKTRIRQEKAKKELPEGFIVE